MALGLGLVGQGLRVLLIDRDNPRHVIGERLRGFGGQFKSLKIISREKCRPLTNAGAWALFPYADYDVVILDSFDSAAEGIGEQDSARPSRGSGVIEPGPTSLTKSGMPPAFTRRVQTGLKNSPLSAAGWASQALRRKQRETFRLAFVASKFRIGVEPEPFVVAIDLTHDPWTVADMTHDIDREGAEAREQRARELAEKISSARGALEAEVLRSALVGSPPLLKDRDAIPLLMTGGLTQKQAREVVNHPQGRWVLEKLLGEKGHPVALLPPNKNPNSDGNEAPWEGAKIQSDNDTHFCRPHEMGATEMHPSEARVNGGSQEPGISVDSSVFSPGDEEELL